MGVANADFFFSEDTMSIVTGDDDGVLRIYEYNPGGKLIFPPRYFISSLSPDPESKNGQHLLCRTEFHGQTESQSSVVIARRSKEDHVLPQAKLIYGEHPRYSPSARLIRDILGSVDGSLSSLTPVDESTFKRLEPLQAQLTRNIQHFAGLNPKAFRFVVFHSVLSSRVFISGSASYETIMFQSRCPRAF